MKNTKKLKRTLAVVLTLTALLAVASCGKDNTPSPDSSIGDIPTASADKGNESENTDSKSEEKDTTAQEDANTTSDSGESSDVVGTPQSDNNEIENNIRDAQELINDGATDDAKALIKVLRTRNLTPDQEKRVDKLETQLISISD